MTTMMLRAVTFALLALLTGLTAAGATPGPAAPAASIVQISALENTVVRVHTIKELKLLRAFKRTLHQQYDFSCGCRGDAVDFPIRPTDR
jgi:hypothetical protein